MSINTIFECSKCGAQTPAWEGRCRECGAWSTLQEVGVKKNNTSKGAETPLNDKEILNLSEIESEKIPRVVLGEVEIDRVLGGGIVPGSLILLGGDPGIGKSTLVLHIADLLNKQQKQLFYISGEESAGQIKMRVDRLGLNLNQTKFINQTETGLICATLAKHKPDVVIIDSIQTMSSDEIAGEIGSVSQVRAVAGRFLETAKQNNITIIIIGHVTKDGQVAGPKMLEHLVDTVLYLEGEKINSFRILRSVKNRFGSTGEVGIFQMNVKGLIPAKNAAGIFVSAIDKVSPGMVFSIIWEGSRAFVVELQVLASKTVFGYPKRTATGFDLNRLQMLLAVLQQRAGIVYSTDDVYVNLAGGLQAKDSGLDLAFCLAALSAKKNKPIAKDTVVFGEVSLTGQIKPVNNMDKRIKEALQLGYKNLIIPQTKKKLTSQKANIVQVSDIKEMVDIIK